MIRILFVCHGNICRSAAAEMILREMLRQEGLEKEIEAASAATSTEEIGNDVYPPMKKALSRRGVPCLPHAARQLTARDGSRYALIIGMDSENLYMMRRMLPREAHGRIRLLMQYTDTPDAEIADPWYTRDFDTAVREITLGCRGLLDSLRKGL